MASQGQVAEAAGETQVELPPKQAPTAKIVAASAFGTIVEWYDFFIYGTAAALVFGRLFFPTSNATVSTLAALSVYAVGYVARPLGGILFGHFGDRVGRKSMLVLSMLLMGFGTLLVGVLPTYEQIGILAPALLILLRLLQAVGLGGEWGGAVLLVCESAPARRRGLFGSFVQLGNPIGRMVATAVFALTTRLPEGDFLSWGWRIPFLASALLVGVGLVIRFQISETPEFQKLKDSKRTSRMPVLEALIQFRRETLTAVGLKITEVAWVGILTVFAVTYLTQQLGMQRSVVLDAVSLATLAELFVMPFSGWLSDRLGRRTIYLAGTAFGILLAFPIFWLFETRDTTIVTLAIVAGIVLCQGIVFALHASFMPETLRHQCALQRHLAGISAWRRHRRRSYTCDCNCDRGLERWRNVAGVAYARSTRSHHVLCGSVHSRDGRQTHALMRVA